MHRYYFRMYELSDMHRHKQGAAKKEVLKAMEGRILAQAELMGTYRRQ